MRNVDLILELSGVNGGTASPVAAIARVSGNIQKHALGRGLKTTVKWLTDGQSMSSVVGIQLGYRRAFPNSEEISVRIFDENNIKVILTDNISRALQTFGVSHGVEVEQLNTFNLDSDAIDFLSVIYDGIGAVSLRL